VQGGVTVAEDFVVDPKSVRALMECFAEERHVGEENGTRCVIEISEVVHNRIGQQQRVAGEELVVAEHRPTRSHAADDGRILVSLGEVDAFVNQCWMVDHIASTDIQTASCLLPRGYRRTENRASSMGSTRLVAPSLEVFFRRVVRAYEAGAFLVADGVVRAADEDRDELEFLASLDP
jgi:hypothetical protein